MTKELIMAKVLTNENFDETIASGVVLVDFWATWCSPCKMLAPTIEELSSDYAGKATVCKVDVDENPELAQRYGIMSIPSVFIFKNGEVKERLIGFRVKSQIAEYLDKHIG